MVAGFSGTGSLAGFGGGVGVAGGRDGVTTTAAAVVGAVAGFSWACAGGVHSAKSEVKANANANANGADFCRVTIACLPSAIAQPRFNLFESVAAPKGLAVDDDVGRTKHARG